MMRARVPGPGPGAGALAREPASLRLRPGAAFGKRLPQKDSESRSPGARDSDAAGETGRRRLLSVQRVTGPDHQGRVGRRVEVGS